MGGVAAVVSVVSTAAKIQEERKAQKAQKTERASERSRARLEAARERRKALRQARIKRGEAVNRGFVSGGEGSIVSGASSSAITQGTGEVGYVNSSLTHSLAASESRQRAADHLGKASMFGSIAGLSSQFATFGGGGNDGKGGTAPIETRDASAAANRNSAAFRDDNIFRRPGFGNV